MATLFFKGLLNLQMEEEKIALRLKSLRVMTSILRYVRSIQNFIYVQLIFLIFSLHLDLPKDSPKLFNQLQSVVWQFKQNQLLGKCNVKDLQVSLLFPCDFCVFTLSNQAGVVYKYLGDNNINIKIGLYTNRNQQ